MKKVIRDTQGKIIGWIKTTDRKGTYNEFHDRAWRIRRGLVLETMKSLDDDTKSLVLEKGELFSSTVGVIRHKRGKNGKKRDKNREGD